MTKCEFCRELVTEGGPAHLECAIQAAHHNAEVAEREAKEASNLWSCAHRKLGGRCNACIACLRDLEAEEGHAKEKAVQKRYAAIRERDEALAQAAAMRKELEVMRER